MSIRVVCPNGHTLNVKDNCAGKTGLCPTCKARVAVPEVARPELSEDAILGILGTHEPASALVDGPHASPSELVGPARPPKKTCLNCDREISAAVHICPHCRTYIAGLKDF